MGMIDFSEDSSARPGTSVPASESADSVPPSDGCPTPQQWQEVLAEFLHAGTHWSFSWGGGEILGRTIGDGPPLYFLNPITGTHELFCLTVWLLRDRYRCVLLDYPDTGTTSLESLAAGVAEVARRHGDEAIDVYAAGFGTLVAWALAESHSKLVSRIVAQGALSEIRPSLAETCLANLGRVWPGRFARVPGRWALQQRSHRPWFPAYDESRFDFYQQCSGKNRTRAVAARFRAAAKGNVIPRLGEVTQPVLLIRSEGEGPVQVRSHEVLTRALPQARTEFLHTCGQLPFLTHPHRLVKLIAAFLPPRAEDCR